MAKLLVVKVNPNPVEASFGLSVGQSFVEAYKAANPSDAVTEINLFEEYVPEVNGELLGAFGALANGTEFSALSPEMQKSVSAGAAIREQFKANDKIVFVTPVWNLSFPARLKSYLDALMVAGETFQYTENGPVGLLENKKALHIVASGGVFNGETHGNSLLRDLLAFMGVTDFTALPIEGMAYMPEKADEIKSAAQAKAVEIVKTF